MIPFRAPFTNEFVERVVIGMKYDARIQVTCGDVTSFQPTTLRNMDLRGDFTARAIPHDAEQKARLTAVGSPEFAVDGTPMTFQSPGRNSQLGGNPFIRHAVASGLEDFLLPLRQIRQGCWSQAIHLISCATAATTAGKT